MTTTIVPQVEVNARNELDRKIMEIGESDAVRRFLNRYGKVRNKSLYAIHVARHFRWLRSRKSVTLSPDDLVVAGSGPPTRMTGLSRGLR